MLFDAFPFIKNGKTLTEEKNLKKNFLFVDLDDSGQSALKLMIPLLILLLVMVAVALLIPGLTTTKAIALTTGVFVFF